MTNSKQSLSVEELQRRAREIEGDSDNPLRVAAANELYAQAAALRSRSPLEDNSNG